MSSPKAKSVSKASAADAQEPSLEEKAAFVKAMLHGIEPGSKAAKAVGDKKAGKKSSAKKADKEKLKKAGKDKKETRKKTKARIAAGQDKSAQEPPSQAAGSALEREAAGEPRVEILRKISAPEPVVSTAKSKEALKLAKEIEQALVKGDMEYIQPHAVQALMMALCKYYAANDEADIVYPILPGRLAISGTDAMVVCGALLRAVDLQVFELGMFQSWSGR